MDIEKALAEIKGAQENQDKFSLFWFTGDIALRANVAPINSKLFIRRKRIMHRMDKIGLPYYAPFLTQLLKWHSVKGLPIKTDVIALKYQLLDDSMRKGLDWTEALDAHIEALAVSAYQAHKEKPRV